MHLSRPLFFILRLARRSSGSGAAAWRGTAEEEGVAMRVREERALHRRSRGGVNEDFSAAAMRAAEGEDVSRKWLGGV